MPFSGIFLIQGDETSVLFASGTGRRVPYLVLPGRLQAACILPTYSPRHHFLGSFRLPEPHTQSTEV